MQRKARVDIDVDLAGNLTIRSYQEIDPPIPGFTQQDYEHYALEKVAELLKESPAAT